MVRLRTSSFLGLALIVGSPAHAQDHPPAQIFKALIETRLAALRRGEASQILALLDTDYVNISDVGARRTLKDMPAYIAMMSNPERTYTVRSVNARVMGDIALVDAEIGEQMMVGVVGGWRESDVFVRKDGRWLYLRRHETAVLYPPGPVPTDDERLGDYVGVYRSAAGLTDIITLKDGTLFGRSKPDEPPTALIHVGWGAFAVPGMTDLMMFARDSAGKVVGIIGHLASGQIMQSQKIAQAPSAQ
ncbi:hypothetical protein BH10PSE12_BH10PSE12_10620 [soil metagenome]